VHDWLHWPHRGRTLRGGLWTHESERVDRGVFGPRRAAVAL